MNWFHQRWHSLSGDLHGISGLQRNWKRTYLNKPLVWLFLIKISVVKMWKKNQIWCNNWPVKSGLLRNITPCDDLDVFTWLNSKTEKQEHWVCFLDFYSCALMLKHPIPLQVLNYTQKLSLSGFIVKCLSFRELNYFFKETSAQNTRVISLFRHEAFSCKLFHQTLDYLYVFSCWTMLLFYVLMN